VTSPASLGHIDAYWASFFGCTIEDLHVPKTVIAPHAALEGYPGITLFRTHGGCIISVPGVLLEQLTRRLSLAPEEIFDRQKLISILGGAIQQLIGPAFVGYADATGFKPADTLGARRLLPADDPALRVLAGSVSLAEWEHGGIEFNGESLIGLFVNNRLVAAGRLEPRDETILDLGLVVARDQRGKGYGRAVASALTASGIEQGKIVQYRTLCSNEASLAIAERLGYHSYAETISVQMNRL
jgi:GNAT superfamily N-acetyltransferase